MQPPSPTPKSVGPMALGLWAATMAPLGIAAATGQPWVLLGLLGVWFLLRWTSRGGAPPRPAVLALESAGFVVLFEADSVRVVVHTGRRVQLHTPRDLRSTGRFVVAVPHALPLADHTWVAAHPSGRDSRHAPWDLRTKVLDRAHSTWPLPHTPVVLTGETVEFHLRTSQASALPDQLPALIDWTRALEQHLVDAIVADLRDAGVHPITMREGPAGSLIFQGPHRGGTVQVHFGRFEDGSATWRGRPELRVQQGQQETVFIGPCTRSIVDDVRTVLDPRLR